MIKTYTFSEGQLDAILYCLDLEKTSISSLGEAYLLYCIDNKIFLEECETEIFDYFREKFKICNESKCRQLFLATQVYQYATNAAKRRLPEFEEIILSHPEIAVDYAERLILGRWLELEQRLLTQEECRAGVAYAKKILKTRWPEFEKILIKKENYYHGALYAAEVLVARWPELEKILIESGNVNACVYYAVNALKSRFKEAEHIIFNNLDAGADPYIWYFFSENDQTDLPEDFKIKLSNFLRKLEMVGALSVQDSTF